MTFFLSLEAWKKWFFPEDSFVMRPTWEQKPPSWWVTMPAMSPGFNLCSMAATLDLGM